ncbi:hypothetical protein Pla175_01840 [Pirellulimonas nuda]|uniref:Flagellar protein FliL n=1 Tax=Pirellulimonas nuda TaxID=2528009 RepID=A0A518D5T3_9BACT|nr:hypothetical protein [Pirellulimonas nuda]QDU86831.1 hypothetical protein Pla175_01840 [Pirellulimonas nuda]
MRALLLLLAAACPLEAIAQQAAHAATPKSATNTTAGAGADASAPAPADEPAFVGVEAGSFFIKNFHPTEGVKQKIAFTLQLEAPAEGAQRTRDLLAALNGRFRDEVITAVRSCDTEVFQEPSLARLSRSITARLRRTLPQLAVGKIYFTDFEYSEE